MIGFTISLFNRCSAFVKLGPAHDSWVPKSIGRSLAGICWALGLLLTVTLLDSQDGIPLTLVMLWYY